MLDPAVIVFYFFVGPSSLPGTAVRADSTLPVMLLFYLYSFVSGPFTVALLDEFNQYISPLPSEITK